MTINRRHFASLFRVDFITVQVTFDDTESYNKSFGKQYTYKAPKDLPIAVDDKLLVMAPGNIVKTVTVAAVNTTPEIDGNKAFDYKWIVGSITDLLKDYEANIARDKQLLAAVAKLEARLEARRLQREVEDMLADLPEAERAEFEALFNGGGTLLQHN